jgi:hypothetical protein
VSSARGGFSSVESAARPVEVRVESLDCCPSVVRQATSHHDRG